MMIGVKPILSCSCLALLLTTARALTDRENAFIGYSERTISTSTSEERNKSPHREQSAHCRDKNENCASWATTGECGINSQYMESNCAYSCDACKVREHWKQCLSFKACKRVFFDISLDGVMLGRVTMDLFFNLLPRTCENFYQLATGQNGYGFQGAKFFRVIPGFMMQSGANGQSIYGPRFDDEGFPLNHSEPYVVAMANGGPNTNGAQFYITVDPMPHLDGKHMVFGTVVSGTSIVDEVVAAGSQSGAMSKPTVIEKSGDMEWTTPTEELV
ncbi:hypothetical protein CYMTET_37496 [Cymbomonas tetramitiformis]|uniref:Peptidyl-prolyl cis-trans isomerase n=1 Tax=Cymbomonas tetramitiformis TaxID=36881 RepID=A0AAE0CDT0_9CHLO|nr:hypothetical protein CYMTET_37496 [Cymbomonas tetramitiformis]